MKFSSLFFALTYIGSVFIFAGIYNTMPNEFYHSTAKYERVINNDYDNIKEDLVRILTENINRAHPTGNLIIGQDTVKINNVNFDDIEIKNSRLNFLFGIGFYSDSKYQRSYFRLSFYCGTGNDVDDSLDNKHVAIKVICSNDTSIYSNDKKSIDAIFTLENFKFNFSGQIPTFNPQCVECNDCGLTVLPWSLNERIAAYSNSLEGFPSSSSGNFERMFYLSAVTITTVGYGDIVPISPRTRMLISIEAIWGIILIGLFLNSLANKISIR